MFKKSPQESLQTFPAQPQKLKEIQAFVSQACLKTPLSAKDSKSIQLAVEEVCTNIIRHSYLFSPGKISITVQTSKDSVALTIADQGRQFDPTEMPDRTLVQYMKTERRGGLGIQLVKKIMDQVEYRYENGENQLKLVKRFSNVPNEPVSGTKRMPLRTRLIWVSFLLLFIIASASYSYLAKRIENSITTRALRSAAEMVQTLARNSSEPLSAGDDLTLSNLVHSFSLGRDIAYLYILDTSRTIWATAKDPTRVLSRWDPPRELDKTRIEPQRYYVSEIGEIYHLSAPIRLSQKRIGAVQIGILVHSIAREVKGAKKELALISFLLLIGGWIGIYFLSGLATKPMQELKEKIHLVQETGEVSQVTQEKNEVGQILNALAEATVKIKQSQKASSQKEQVKRETELADEIRQALLPKEIPQIKNAQIASLYKVAREIGGDYFDFVWVDENHLGIAVADIAGKGVSASLVMSAIRTALRLQARQNQDPAAVLEKIDSFIAAEMPKGMFVTMFYAVLDLQTKEMKCASAGHTPGLVYRLAENKLIRLNPKGLPLGLTFSVSGQKRDSLTFQMAEGDLLVLYTDGVTECLNPQGEQFGLNRLTEFLQTNGHLNSDLIAKSLDQKLLEFSGRAEPKDDITLVIFKQLTESEAANSEQKKRLARLFENDQFDLKQACQELKISLSSYRKYRARKERAQKAALADRAKSLNGDSTNLLPGIRERLSKMIGQHPEYGPVRLTRELASTLSSKEPQVARKLVYGELLNLKLATSKSRYEYILRTKGDLKPKWAEAYEKLSSEDQRASIIYELEQEMIKRRSLAANAIDSDTSSSASNDQILDGSTRIESQSKSEGMVALSKEAGP